MMEYSASTSAVEGCLAFANEMADAARPIALSYFRTKLDVENKGDGSPVTVADRTIEECLRSMIERRFPEHGILGEEFGFKQGNGFTWVIDPIDGTKSFITGNPLFGTLISLVKDHVSICGIIDIPFTFERWVGWPGSTTLNGRLTKTSDCVLLSEASLYATSPDMFARAGASAFDRLSASVKFRRFGGSCYLYGLLASGHCDIVFENMMQPYDFMALVPVVEGAGGLITDWQGRSLGLDCSGGVLATAKSTLHDQVLAAIRE